MNELSTQISEVANIRRASRSSSDIMTKTIAQLRGVEALILAHQNPPKELQ